MEKRHQTHSVDSQSLYIPMGVGYGVGVGGCCRPSSVRASRAILGNVTKQVKLCVACSLMRENAFNQMITLVSVSAKEQTCSEK